MFITYRNSKPISRTILPWQVETGNSERHPYAKKNAGKNPHPLRYLEISCPVSWSTCQLCPAIRRHMWYTKSDEIVLMWEGESGLQNLQLQALSNSHLQKTLLWTSQPGRFGKTNPQVLIASIPWKQGVWHALWFIIYLYTPHWPTVDHNQPYPNLFITSKNAGAPW